MYEDVFIHPTAVIDKGAQIGIGTKIWHFSHLMPRCTIGDRCIIGQNVFVDNDVTTGHGVKIQNNVSVYKGVTIEDDAFIGPSVVFTNVINPRSFVERKHEFKPTVVRKGASIGANATIICGVEIGAYAMVGAGAVVTQNVAAFALVHGVPTRHHGWISRMGYPLHFDETAEARCPATGQRYQLTGDGVQAL